MIIAINGKIGSGKDTVGNIIRYLVQQTRIGEPHTWENYVDWNYQNDLQYENDWEIRKFADKLKDMVCLLIGCTREQLEDHEFKNKELGEEWKGYRIISNHTSWLNLSVEKVFLTTEDAYSWIDTLVHINNPRNYFAATEIYLTPRLLLQLLGTECGREILHPNIWVNSLFTDYKSPLISKFRRSGIDPTQKNIENSYPNWLITDTRFENEAQAVKDRGGILIRINRDTEYLKCLNDPVYFVENYIRTNKEEKIELREFDKDFIRKHCKSTKEHPSETALDNYQGFDYIIDNNGTIEELIEKVREILIKEKIL